MIPAKPGTLLLLLFIGLSGFQITTTSASKIAMSTVTASASTVTSPATTVTATASTVTASASTVTSPATTVTATASTSTMQATTSTMSSSTTATSPSQTGSTITSITTTSASLQTSTTATAIMTGSSQLTTLVSPLQQTHVSISLATTDANGNSKSSFLRGDTVLVKITLTNDGAVSMNNIYVLETIYDSSNSPIFSGISVSTLAPGTQSQVSLGAPLGTSIATGKFHAEVIVLTAVLASGGHYIPDGTGSVSFSVS